MTSHDGGKENKKMKCVSGERCLRSGNANVNFPPERATRKSSNSEKASRGNRSPGLAGVAPSLKSFPPSARQHLPEKRGRSLTPSQLAAARLRLGCRHPARKVGFLPLRFRWLRSNRPLSTAPNQNARSSAAAQ